MELEHGLLAIARQNPVSQVEVSPYGTKYSIEGELLTPKGVIDLGQDSLDYRDRSNSSTFCNGLSGRKGESK